MGGRVLWADLSWPVLTQVTLSRFPGPLWPVDPDFSLSLCGAE